MKKSILLITLLLLALTTTGIALAQQPPAACESAYTVQPGDWLGKVAAQTYGDSALYPAIAAATNANLGPDYPNFIGANNLILPGWTLCLPGQADAAALAATATDDPATLTVDDLQNATYSSDYAGEAPFTLVNGEYRQPVPDSTGEESYTLADTFAFADVDGDGSEDALAVLISNPGGTGRFYHLVLMLNKNGLPTQADSASLGDRSPVKAINLVGSDIYVDYVTQGPNDAACCGTQATSQKFRVENGKLFSTEADIQASQTSEALTREKLWNATYPFDEGEQITFANGKYADQPEGEGSASFSAAEMLAPLAFGDLTGDGIEDAVVTFSYSGGGSGDFLYLAVAEGKGTQPVGQASLWLDTAGQINGVAIDNGQIKVDLLRFGPGDAECCATEQVVVTYTLQDGLLVEGETQVITPAAPAPGERITRVVELTAVPVQWRSFTDPTQQFDLADPENYTIAFNPDGTVNVKADCNNARGTYTADDSGSLTIEIGPMTKAMCPPDSRSDEFVQKLGFVRGFFMENGFVYLDMLADGGTLQLAPASESMVAPKSAPAFGAAWESVSCDTLGVAPEIAAVADCGYVTVPENRAAGTAKTIQLPVVRVRSTSANPGTPVLLGTGGPGSNGLQSASDATFLTSHADILADRDWVFFSQRGTAQAKPELVCPAYNDVPLQGALNGWTDEEKQARNIETMQACLDDFTAQGVDLTGYNSVENAADVADITRALGYDKINYYGQSYGTLLGQYLLRNHPEIIETITLDGIAPASAQRWTDVTDYTAAFQRVFAACAADEACAANYPDPAAALAEALTAMDANPPLVTVQLPGGEAKTMAVDEVLAMNALFINLYIPGGYGKVPFLAYELRNSNYDQLASTLAVHFLNSGEARVMHFAIVCSDDPVASLDEVNLTNVPEIYKGIILDDATSYATFCPQLNLPQLPASSDELPVSDVPALLLQGGLDPATPVEGGNKLVDGLPNSYNVIFPSGAHIQASHSPCALNILDAFLADPATPPDTRCVDPAIPFAVPGAVSVSSADGSAVITMTLPAGFVAGPNPGMWNDGAMLFGLEAFEAGTSVAEALEKPMGAVQLASGEAVEGPMIAGYPSMATQIEMPLNGVTQYFDRFAFSDGERAYRLLVEMTNPATLDNVRQKLVPELLKSITISNTTTDGPASGSAAPVESALASSDAWKPVSCDTFGLSATVAEMSDCGYVTVPEFHNQPAGPTIQVAVVRTRSSSDTPAPDPLFMEQGGPGGSTLDIYPAIALTALPNMKTLLNTRDLVFVEQRGTRHSKPGLLCPEQTAANVATMQGLQDKDDVSYLKVCYDRLQAEGVNFDAFNTVQNAADMYAVAEALGYSAFNYYGVSYGTLLGQYVIAQAQEHPVQLRSAIIDAVVAPDVDFNAKPGDTASYALRNVFTGCAQDEICNRDFPNLESVFLGLVDQLNRQPITVTVTVPEAVRAAVPAAPATIDATVTGEAFADVSFQHLYSMDKGRILPRHIYAAQNNDFSWVAQGLADGLAANTATGMYFTMLCSRQNSITNPGDFFGAPYPELAFKDDDSDFFQGCRIFDVDPEGDAFTFADNSTPTLILNGANDPITPQPYGEYVGSLLDTAYVYTFPGMGHGAILDSPCAADIAVDFLADPTQSPDSSCLSSLKPVFYGFPTPLEQLTLVTTTLPSSVTLALPSQWTLGSMGLYTDPSDPASFSTGGVLVAVVADKTPAETAAVLGGNFKEIARDQAIGSHLWLVLEETQPGLVITHVGIAADEAAGGSVLVQLSASPATAEAVFAKLWEPILSSVEISSGTTVAEE